MIRAQKLYLANLRLAGAFYPLLGCFEVALRNRLNTVLAAYFADSHWLITQQQGFMADPSLVFRNQRTGQVIRNGFLRQELANAERKIVAAGLVVTADRLVAGQTLAFWVDLFSLKHFRLLRGRPIQAFQNLPAGVGRVEILQGLTAVRIFRNRIFHHEPVCFSGNIISGVEAALMHRSLLQVMDWLSPDLLPFVAKLDEIEPEIAALQSI